MDITGAPLCKALGAVPTLVWFFARVRAFVNLQITAFAESLPAKTADMIPWPHVRLLMADQQGSISEGFIAITTALDSLTHWKIWHSGIFAIRFWSLLAFPLPMCYLCSFVL